MIKFFIRYQQIVKVNLFLFNRTNQKRKVKLQEDLFNRPMYINLNLLSDCISVWKLYGNYMEMMRKVWV